MDDSFEARLQVTLNVIPVQAWYAASTGALTFVNERTADYLGLPTDHPFRFGVDTGAAWDSLIALLHPEDHDETRQAWSNCLKPGSAAQLAFRVRNAQGGYRWFIGSVEPLRGSDGKLLYWIGVNVDIEERKQAEFYLRRSEEAYRAFKCRFGASPRDYVLRRRIEVAQGLMLTTSEPISSIAIRCGMCDQPHFTRSFHRIVGQTPCTWRRTRRGSLKID